MRKKKNSIIIAAILLAIVFIYFMQSSTKYYLNALRKNYLKSDSGEFSVYMEWNTGEEVTINTSDIQYEVRDDGFYYKETRYEFGDQGELVPQGITEVFEGGKRIKLDSSYEITDPEGERISLETLLGGVWAKLHLFDVKNITEENEGPYTRYTVCFCSKHTDANDNIPDEAKYSELILIVDKEKNEVKELRRHTQGMQDPYGQNLISVDVKLQFR